MKELLRILVFLGMVSAFVLILNTFGINDLFGEDVFKTKRNILHYVGVMLGLIVAFSWASEWLVAKFEPRATTARDPTASADQAATNPAPRESGRV